MVKLLNGRLSELAQGIDLKSIERKLVEGSNPSSPTILNILGPYIRKDRRKHVIVYWSDKRKQTLSYPRLLWMAAGNELTNEDTIDHINGDFTDDRLENLQVLSLAANVSKSSRKAEWIEFVCPFCGVLAKQRANHSRHNRKQGKKGPFCSKSCAAKATYMRS